jgi:hypothetical protein
MMHVVEILLPLTDNEGRPFQASAFGGVRDELTKRFGGLTAFMRSPARGLTERDGNIVKDEIVIFEVMTEALERDWWNHYRCHLEREFRQDEIVIRALEIERL